MNKFVYTALALGGLTHAAGCVIVTSDSGDLDVAWEIQGEYDYGDGCDQIEAPSVDVFVEDLSSGTVDVFGPFDCSSGGVLVENLSTGDYLVYADAVDSAGRIFGRSTAERATVRGGSIVEAPILGFENGRFEGTWLITDADTNTAETCDWAGAGGVSILSTVAGSGGTGFDDIFSCPASADEGDVRTSPLPLGDYTISVSILEEGTDAALGISDPRNDSLDFHGHVNDLGVFEFLF